MQAFNTNYYIIVLHNNYYIIINCVKSTLDNFYVYKIWCKTNRFIEWNRYGFHTITMERNPSKYVILESVFPAGFGNDWCPRDHFFDLFAEERSGSKKKCEEDTERKDQQKLTEIFSDESVWRKSLLGFLGLDLRV